MLSRPFGVPCRREGPPSIWDTHGTSGNVFGNPDASSSAPYPQELHQWNSSSEEPLHSSTVDKSERQEQNQDLRCQSEPPAKDWRRLIKELWGRPTTTADCGSSFRQIPNTSHMCLLEDKIQKLSCSQFLTEAMLWIKEVEMVESSVRGIQMPKVQVLDAKIAPALNRIVHNSHFKRRIGLEEQKAQKQDRFLRGRQIAYLIYEYFRVTGANDSVENYADLFTISLRNDHIQEFDSKWDGILLSMTKITSGDILEGLYTLRIRESEKLKTVLELYNMEIHQKKAAPDYHRLKTMVKRSIEQNLRIKNLEARNGNYERNALVKNQGTKQREQRTLGDCWQWGKPTGSVLKETIAVSATI